MGAVLVPVASALALSAGGVPGHAAGVPSATRPALAVAVDDAPSTPTDPTPATTPDAIPASQPDPIPATTSTTTPATAPSTTPNEFFPEDRNIGDCLGALERPGCGSEARGGWRQAAVFGALVLGLAAVFGRIGYAVFRNRG